PTSARPAVTLDAAKLSDAPARPAGGGVSFACFRAFTLRNLSTWPDTFFRASRAVGIGFSICTDGIFACKALMTPATGESRPCGQARLMTRRNSLFITKRGMIRWLVLETRRQMLGSE